MEKKFNPSNFEKRIYENWVNKKYFQAKVNKNKKPFTIIMPPPNITSRLHIGHAYGIAIMDSITRFKRMQGFEALLLPGSDHAAIATEARVVDKLAKEGITKQQLGREKFIEKMHEWYDEYGAAINEQFKLVGLSCDWERFAFTLDEPRSRAVRESFVRLYKKGYIYQGDRITNWCPSCKTALSDIEVEYEENEGSIWYLKYPIENSNEFLTLATTRPETMLGDVAVAVNPKDKRYKKLVGKNVILPLVNKAIPVIADNYVEVEFGTGVVKITPAHDPNDYEVGLRHNLPIISVLNESAVVNENGGIYEGLPRFVARERIVADLKDLGLLEKIEKYHNNVGHCQRCHSVVEPMISKQWYVKMAKMAERAVKVVEEKEIKFIPARFEKTYFNWMNNIKDWCISRQIWSGHRIPVFNCENCGHQIVEVDDPTFCPRCKSKNLSQETDSLDTWFSSALWPFSTLGWPNNTEDLQYFFPTDLMVTAYDIIFFWVARMIFSSLEYTDKIPFKNVLFHGIIRDGQGRKMSKSLGNGVDPIEIIDKYGADVLRLSMLQGIGVGQDGRFGEEKAQSMSNFLNKIWNASRFVVDNLKKVDFKIQRLENCNLTLSDKWILHELNLVTAEVIKAYDKYDLGLVISKMYDFVWNKFCDWYIESSKVKLNADSEQSKIEVLNVLVHVLENSLKLLHPIIPFVTEEIYLNLPAHEETIMLASFPKTNKKCNYSQSAKTFELVMDLVKGVRNLRSELNIADNVKLPLHLIAYNEKELLANNLEVISKLALATQTTLIENEESVEGKFVFALNELGKLVLPTKSIIDPEKELQKLENELALARKELARAEGMLKNESFMSKAPKALVEAEREKVEQYSRLENTILENIKKL